VAKALKEIGFDQYLQAEQTGWVLYLEGSTDLAILRAFAKVLEHPASAVLERPFVHYVANQPGRTRDHFYGLREAKPDLVGVALYDRLDIPPRPDPTLMHLMWRRREIENYLCQPETLLAFARNLGRDDAGELFVQRHATVMDEAIKEVRGALATLGRPDPWGADAKVSDDFLGPVFMAFYGKLGLQQTLMRKTDFHTLARFVPKESLDPEVSEKLDRIVEVSAQARPGATEGGR
jgi:hypothetical protein